MNDDIEDLLAQRAKTEAKIKYLLGLTRQLLILLIVAIQDFEQENAPPPSCGCCDDENEKPHNTILQQNLDQMD